MMVLLRSYYRKTTADLTELSISLGTWLTRIFFMMKWPAQTPDLNPIEKVWGLMKSLLRKRTKHPSNPVHLFQIFNEICIVLPDSYFTTLVPSIPNRFRNVHQKKGRSTE